jgi:hypothetical protein
MQKLRNEWAREDQTLEVRGGDHCCRLVHSESPDQLPLGQPTPPATAYWRKLLFSHHITLELRTIWLVRDRPGSGLLPRLRPEAGQQVARPDAYHNQPEIDGPL